MGHFEDLEAGFEIKDENILNSLKGFINPNKSDSPIEYDLSSIELYVKENKIDELKQYMLDNDLELSDDNRIISKHRKYFNEASKLLGFGTICEENLFELILWCYFE